MVVDVWAALTERGQPVPAGSMLLRASFAPRASFSLLVILTPSFALQIVAEGYFLLLVVLRDCFFAFAAAEDQFSSKA